MKAKTKYQRCPRLRKGFTYNNLYAILPAEYKDALREIAKKENASMRYVVLHMLIDWIHGNTRIPYPKFDTVSLKLVKGARRKKVA